MDQFPQGFIGVHDAQQNNLRHVSVTIPKYRVTAFVGLSGSGKSSLVFDTIAASSRRELNETFPSSVSYTHLGVYKRQPQGHRRDRLFDRLGHPQRPGEAGQR